MRQVNVEKASGAKDAKAKDGKKIKRDGLPESINPDARIKGAERK